MNAPLQFPALVLGMPDDEWASALYVSDMPTRRGEHTADQIAEWIVQGVERLGGEVEAWQHSRQSREVLTGHGPFTDAQRAEWRRLWPSPRRQNRAWDLAYTLSALMRESGVSRPDFRTAPVPLGDDEMGQHWSIEVPERDLRMQERCAALAGKGVE